MVKEIYTRSPDDPNYVFGVYEHSNPIETIVTKIKMILLEQFGPVMREYFVTIHTNDIFYEIGMIIIISTVFAFIARGFKQPLIPAYIITGLLIGPFLGLVDRKSVV